MAVCLSAVKGAAGWGPLKKVEGVLKVYTVPLEPLQVLSMTLTFKGAPENLA